MNVDLIKFILTEVNQSVKSPEDVISPFALPFFFKDEIGKYKEKFGEELIVKYMSLNNQIENIRNKTLDLIRNEKAEYKRALTSLVTAFYGVGNCGEKTYLTVTKLIEKGYLGDISLCIYESPCKRYNHSFIIISDKDYNVYSSLIDFLNSLNSEFLLIDPLLNIICRPDRLSSKLTGSKLTEYLNQYGITNLREIIVYNCSHKEIFQYLVTRAKHLSAHLKHENSISNLPEIKLSSKVQDNESYTENPTKIIVQQNQITRQLNRFSNLKFFTSCDDKYNADAVAIINSPTEIKEASRISEILGKGCNFNYINGNLNFTLLNINDESLSMQDIEKLDTRLDYKKN